jgi:prolyl-tRNA synthetase
MSDFTKEKDHIEGFAPETFIVDKIGNETLSEELIIRPTSEVLFSQLFKEQIHSYKDLPMKYNQWCSVYRAEKNTKPFLRGCEFFWHELHCMFETQNEAQNFTIEIHKLYNKFLKDVCYLPVLSGKKTEGEKFAGAVETYTREVWSQDGQCIQTGTSHYLGTNFSKIYDVNFQDKQNTIISPHYTSHGITTRIIGDLVVVHGDDKGLVLPFDIAPIQVSILTIFQDKDPNIITIAKKIADQFKSFRTKIDDSNNGFGFKISEQEINGTPFVIVIGPNDIKEDNCTLIRRDNGIKQTIKISDIKNEIIKQKKEYFKSLYTKAKQHLDSSIVQISDIESFKNAINEHKIALGY